MEIISRLKLIDFFFLLLCLRIIYTAVSGGILIEIFRILGLFFGSIFAFHYYPFLAAKIENSLSLPLGEKVIPYLYSFSFFFLTLGIKMVFSLLGRIVNTFFKKEKTSFKEKWFSLGLGLARTTFLSSIIIFFLFLSPFHGESFSKSFSYQAFKNIAPAIYLGSVEFYHKFNPRIKLNKEVKKYYESRYTFR